jgi:hypothetical protein
MRILKTAPTIPVFVFIAVFYVCFIVDFNLVFIKMFQTSQFVVKFIMKPANQCSVPGYEVDAQFTNRFVNFIIRF